MDDTRHPKALKPQRTERLLSAKEDGSGWMTTGGENPWGFQERMCSDGQKAQVISSLVHGEQLTGVLRSAAFALPAKLSFFLCGHDGFPDKPAGKKNFARLRDAADGRVLREAAPPRNDTAQRIEWSLAEFAGRSGFVEITDGDSGTAYAWLAVTRFEPKLPQLALADPKSAAQKKTVAADIARGLNLTVLTPALSAVFVERKNDTDARAAAARTLIALDSSTHAAAIAAAIASADEPDALRERLAVVLGEVKSPGVCQRVADAMPTASSRLQQSFATALSANRCGAVVLITAIENGKASVTVLRDKATVDRLLASGADEEDARLRELLKKLPPANAAADQLIAARRAAFDPARADATRGADVFTRNCAVCHAIEGKGAAIGPQLDGIGGRGADRLFEDILDPNRNVDRAFRLTLVTKKDGGIVSGLLRREEGAQLVLADLTGQEQGVAKADVQNRQETETSLMPPVFGDVIPPAELNDLLAYLLSKRAVAR